MVNCGLPGVRVTLYGKPAMKSRTSFWGYAAALGYAVHEWIGLPIWAHNATHVLVAVAIALVGYHAQDSLPGKGPPGSGPLLPLLVVSLCLLSGCQLAGLGVAVKSPTFGEVGVTIGGGVIGRPGPVASSNLLCYPLQPPQSSP